MNTVLLTGGTGALGAVVAPRLVADGYRLIVPYISEKEAIRFRASAAPDVIEPTTFIRADMLNQDEVERVFASFPSGHRLYSLVHLLGGVRSFKPVAETTPEDWDELMRLNLRSLFLAARLAMRVFQENGGGRIVTVGAMAGIKPSATQSAYGVSKAGVIALTGILADEGRSHGVTVNCVAPSIIRTAANLEWGSEAEAKDWVTPEEIAATISFLLSPAAAGVNGTVIRAFGALNI